MKTIDYVIDGESWNPTTDPTAHPSVPSVNPTVNPTVSPVESGINDAYGDLKYLFILICSHLLYVYTVQFS